MLTIRPLQQQLSHSLDLMISCTKDYLVFEIDEHDQYLIFHMFNGPSASYKGKIAYETSTFYESFDVV